jgi:hypothetical protein
MRLIILFISSLFCYSTNPETRKRRLEERDESLFSRALEWGKLEVQAYRILATETEQAFVERRSPRNIGELLPVLNDQVTTIDGQPFSPARAAIWYSAVLQADVTRRVGSAETLMADFIRSEISLKTSSSNIDYFHMSDLAWDEFVFPVLNQELQKQSNSDEPTPVCAAKTTDVKCTRVPSPRFFLDKVPPIAREYVHQLFPIHGKEAASVIKSDIGIPNVSALLRGYFLSFYTLGYVHTEAFDYLIGGNGRRCLETPTSRLSDELNQLEYPHGIRIMYTAGRVAFWCNDIIKNKSPEELLAFRDSHATVTPTGFVKLTPEEYSTLIIARLRTSFSTRIITPQAVLAAMTT